LIGEALDCRRLTTWTGESEHFRRVVSVRHADLDRGEHALRFARDEI
jgi:hypothetical protein